MSNEADDKPAALTPEEASLEAIDCARYGEHADLERMIEARADVNYRGSGGNTALHMACANGHMECVSLLLKHGARHVGNDSGNTPLHWAVLNKSLEVVRELCTSAPDLDVLAKNSFGKSALTDAYGSGESGTPLTKLLLEHKSADKLEETKEGSVRIEDGGDTNQDDANAGEAPDANSSDTAATPSAADTDSAKAAASAPASATTTAASSNIVQSYTYVFDFSSPKGQGPEVRAREVATDWQGAVFGEGANAEEDTTGMQVWATSLVTARWVSALQQDPATSFEGRCVMELGAGAGVPGLTALFYSRASKVILTDVFKHTLTNLRFNVAINLKHNQGLRDYSDVQVRALDWRDRGEDTAGAMDVLLGSDLVYDDALVPPLLEFVDHAMAPQGVFYMVAADGRRGVQTLIDAFDKANFDVESKTAPEEFKSNPLVSGSDAELELHFNELHSTIHTLYTVRRKQS
eukprot:m.9060 g.9060  ORF g.9060 m.9060 type:complete len:464 (+) comp2590_c0_seq2:119-1510(+)